VVEWPYIEGATGGLAMPEHYIVWDENKGMAVLCDPKFYLAQTRNILRFSGLPPSGYVVNMDDVNVVSLEQRYNDIREKLAEKLRVLGQQFEGIGMDSICIHTYNSDYDPTIRHTYYMEDGGLCCEMDSADTPVNYDPSTQELELHRAFKKYMNQWERLYAFRSVISEILRQDIVDNFECHKGDNHFFVTINQRNYRVVINGIRANFEFVADQSKTIKGYTVAPR